MSLIKTNHHLQTNNKNNPLLGNDKIIKVQCNKSQHNGHGPTKTNWKKAYPWMSMDMHGHPWASADKGMRGYHRDPWLSHG